MLAHISLVSFILSHGALCAQPSAPLPSPAPLRELPWGQLNFLHTTDIHGWWGGHLQEPSFSADWGDYISFAAHLRARADATGTDLILVDTGDRIEGNAIYDSSLPRGKLTYPIAREQHIDLICSGNHELYKAESANGEFYHTVPDFRDNYLASNLDIVNPDTGKRQPLARRYRTFTTKNQGIRVLAFGFIFDFQGNDNNTFVIPVADTIEQDWFKEAIRIEDIDLIVVYGHVDMRSAEYTLLFSTIRSVRWDMPIQFFGGHSHIRDYRVFDAKSVGLESGRYMETLGFMSISGLATGGASSQPARKASRKPTFARRYIDNNLFSLHHHSGKNASTFATSRGTNVSATIGAARDSLNLNEQYGCAPRDLWVSRRPYPHPSSIFSWLATELFPQSIGPRLAAGKKALIIANTGGIRFDIFKGPFTKDTKFLVSPFTSSIRYIEDVPFAVASKLLPLLNNEGPIAQAIREARVHPRPPEHMHQQASHPHEGGRIAFMNGFGAKDTHAQHAHAALGHDHQHPIHIDRPLLTSSHDDDGNEPKLEPGYTTSDDAGTDGDDTLHVPIPFFSLPNCIQATVGFDTTAILFEDDGDDNAVVHVYYNEFLQPWILLALDYLGATYDKDKDTKAFRGGKSFSDVMVDWVKEHWPCDS